MRHRRMKMIIYALCFILTSLLGFACARMMAPSFGFVEENQPSPVATPVDPSTTENQTSTLNESPDFAQSSQSLQSQPVTIHEPVHFVGIDGEDVLVQPGSYSLRAAGESSLEILSTDVVKNLVIRASKTMHELEAGDAIALALKDGDEQHLLLYLPGGKGLDAVGSASEVRPRATVLSPLSPTRTNELLSASTTTTASLSTSLPAIPMVMDGLATPAGREQINLTAGVRITIETTAITGGDPVLHLLTVRGNELAYDDNGAGGTGARLTFTPQQTEPAVIVVRSRTQTTGGRCDLLLNGSIWRRNVPFGGWHVSLPGLRVNEEIETVQRPGGHGGGHVVYILKSNGLGIQSTHEGGGTGFGVRFRLATGLGSRGAIVSVLPAGDVPHEPVRLIRNDVALAVHDPDGDGLGTELEATIGTCSGLSGFAKNFDCSLAADPRDTDGDGINDGWELLGRRDMKPHQLLPAWGADPRHKDLFFEVDFMRRFPEETPQRMSEKVAWEFARYYQDEVGSANPPHVETLLRAYHAATLRNPDGLPGIRVHLDTGITPRASVENPVIIPNTVYGDWGGYNAVAPVRDQNGNWVGANPHEVWRTQMTPARVGIFRYMLAYMGSGGQNPVNTYACAGSITNSWHLAHECAHAMGLGHSGPDRVTGDIDVNCKPNYPSLVNYAFSDGSVGFSDNTGTPTLNNWALREWNGLQGFTPALANLLETKFQYVVDRSAGHIDWNRDGIIAPSGATVRAYANFTPSSVGCEYTRYNQSRVSTAVSTRSPAMARLGNRLYAFYVEAGVVKYAYSTSNWNCPVPSLTSCGSWSPAISFLLNGTGGVDVTRVVRGAIQELLVVSVDHRGQLWQRRISADGVPGPPTIIPYSGPATGEPGLEYFKGAAYLVYKGRDLRIRLNRLDSDAGWVGESEVLSPSGRGIVSASYASPALIRAQLRWKPGVQLYGAFPNADGKLTIWWLNFESARWEQTSLLGTLAGPVYGRPALAWVPYQTGVFYPGRLYLLYSLYNQTNPQEQVVRMMMSHVKNTEEVIGLHADFDNYSLFAYGADLLYEPGVDSNLRAVLAYTYTDEKKRGVWLRPKADGIQDFAYTNYNDWQVLRVGICEPLVKEAPLPQPPIRCAVKSW